MSARAVEPEQESRSREVTAVIPLPPLVGYERVSDVVATSAHSDETEHVRWVRRQRQDGVSVGDRFAADNSTMGMSWTSTSIVTAADPGRRFSFAVSSVENPTAVWTFLLAADPGGTRVSYRVELGDGPSMFEVVTGGDPSRRAEVEQFRLDALAEGMATMLERLGSECAD